MSLLPLKWFIFFKWFSRTTAGNPVISTKEITSALDFFLITLSLSNLKKFADFILT